MTTLYAQPYDLAANGFYFDSAEAYAKEASRLRNAYGQPVEEFEIQFIDGEAIDAELFEALRLSQVNFSGYFDAVADWRDDQKVRTIIAVGEVGISFTLGDDDPDAFDIDLYEIDTLRDLAIQFVDEGLFGEIPKAIENYLDYDAIARDLSMDYGTTTIAGTRYAYRAA
jgi:hypothetical protein